MKASYKIITRKTLAEEAAERFRSQYFFPGPKKWATFENNPSWPHQPEWVYSELLKAKGNPDRVEQLLPNGGWIEIFCDQCNKSVPLGVEIDLDQEYGTSICLPCLRKITHELERVAELSANSGVRPA